MKEYLASLVKQTTSPLEGRNLAREYLQARILGSLQRSGAMIPLAFHGGTALRFLYSHGRYSEDLDFTLEGNRQSYDFRSYLHAIRSELTPEGYKVDIKVNDKKTVNSAFVCFPGLLFEMGLSPQQSEVLDFLTPLCVGLLCFNFIIMTKLPCYPANCMQFCSGPIPKDAIFMICSGT